MKITDIEGIMLRLPEVRMIGDGCQTILIIKIHTDAGITGIGEAHSNPLVSKAVLEAPLCSVSASGLRGLLIGEDPRDINRLYDLMVRRSVTYGRRGAVMHVVSGIEIALWDILGKVTQQPIYRLLGGARRRDIPAYASDLAPETSAGAVALAERKERVVLVDLRARVERWWEDRAAGDAGDSRRPPRDVDRSERSRPLHRR